MHKKTVQFYDDNAGDWLAFIERGVKYRKTSHKLFLKAVPKGGLILDAGCGTGHDSRHFLAKQRQVNAFDASAEMIKIAKDLTGLNIRHDTFEKIKLEKDYYDGLWTHASLLHLQQEKYPRIFKKLWRSLKSGGAWYIMTRYGHRPAYHGVRYFSVMNKTTMRDMAKTLPGCRIEHLAIEHGNSAPWKWLHAMLVKE